MKSPAKKNVVEPVTCKVPPSYSMFHAAFIHNPAMEMSDAIKAVNSIILCLSHRLDFSQQNRYNKKGNAKRPVINKPTVNIIGRRIPEIPERY